MSITLPTIAGKLSLATVTSLSLRDPESAGSPLNSVERYLARRRNGGPYGLEDRRPQPLGYSINSGQRINN